jgi:hypothetical protein
MAFCGPEIRLPAGSPNCIHTTDKKRILNVERVFSEAEKMFSAVVSGNAHRRYVTGAVPRAPA